MGWSAGRGLAESQWFTNLAVQGNRHFKKCLAFVPEILIELGLLLVFFKKPPHIILGHIQG